jgi:hypothetical protein
MVLLGDGDFFLLYVIVMIPSHPVRRDINVPATFTKSAKAD